MQKTAFAPGGDSPCEWADAAQRFRLHLDPNLMARLGIESWAAYKQVPKRGLEIGGILLGRTEVTDDFVDLWIDRYQVVDSEHRWGPSYLLSDHDFERLEDNVRSSGTAAIGLFRTHTRSEELAFEQRDSEVLERCCDGDPAVLLLLGPVAGQAAVFANVQGELQCVLKCPLESPLSAMLTRRHERPATQNVSPTAMERRNAVAVPTGVPEPPPVVGTIQPPERSSPPPTSAARTWVTAAAIALLACAAIADYVSRSLHHQTLQPSFLHLSVERLGSSLRLGWDPKASGLQGAGHAVLRVEDGDRISENVLNPAELKGGTASYTPHSNSVTFRLEIYPAEPKSSGVIQVVDAQPVPANQAARLPANQTAQAVTAKPPGDDPRPEKAGEVRPAKAAAAQERAAFLGLSVAPLSPALRGRFHLPASASGVVVINVRPVSAAAQARIAEGDLIQEVNRQPIAGVEEFEQAMHNAPKGSLLFSVSRGGTLTFHAMP